MPQPEVRRVQRQESGKIYVFTTGGYADNGGLVTVVRTMAATMACLTCHRIDCAHAKVAAAHIKEHGAMMPAEVARAG